MRNARPVSFRNQRNRHDFAVDETQPSPATAPDTNIAMSQLFLAIFLIVFGMNLLFGLLIPYWVTGLLAVVAGIMIVIRRYGLPPKYRKQAREAADRNG